MTSSHLIDAEQLLADQPAARAQKLPQRRPEVLAGQPVQLQQRQHLLDLRRLGRPRRQNR